jgi:hypothetical protein
MRNRLSFSFLILLLLVVLPLTTQAAPSDKDVVVINTPAQPVPTAAQGTTTVAGTVSLAPGTTVNVLSNDARQPFQAAASQVQNGTNVSTLTIATVPAGKRLVIEFISLSGQVPPTQHVELMQVLTVTDTGGVFHDMLIHEQPDAVIGDALFRSVQSLRLYANAGTQINVVLRRSSSIGQATYGASISGYLVDL